MSMQTPTGIVRLALVLTLGVAPVASLVGCGGEDPAVAKAREVLATQAATGPDQAEYAANLIADNRTPQGEEVLAGLIATDNNQIARAAVSAIVDDPPPSLQETLKQRFATAGGLLKLDTGIALARLGDAEARAWVEGEVLARGGVSMTLSAFKLLAPDQQEALTEIVKSRMASDEVSIRNEVYGFLAESDQPWATPLLIKGVQNETGADREQAIMSLAATGDPEAAAEIQKHLRTRGLVFVAIEALGELGNPDALPQVKRSLESDTAVVRLYAAVAAWKLGDTETALSVLEPMVADESADLRSNLAVQLANVDAPEATRMLLELARDDDAQVRVDAVRALVDREDPEVQALMLEALGDNFQVKTLALDNLGQYGGAEALDAIKPLLEDRNPYVAMGAANAVLGIKNRAPEA